MASPLHVRVTAAPSGMGVRADRVSLSRGAVRSVFSHDHLKPLRSTPIEPGLVFTLSQGHRRQANVPLLNDFLVSSENLQLHLHQGLQK